MTVINALKTLGMTILLGALIMGLSGCPASLSGSAYSRNQARTLQTVETGTVESVRQVFIEGTKTGLGGASGAALGGLAASNIGGGRGQVAATIGGALIGGVAGAAAANLARSGGGRRCGSLSGAGAFAAADSHGFGDKHLGRHLPGARLYRDARAVG